ncbi:MAG TPA: DUF1579 family protein [Methylibium sp.]|uniref:DUF1579 family protein n=1 Tax=Methylibium sp. TaxID=2067992 RepID=UPI002DB9E5AC|nr:DUF1579 family protein [Methylibium sp.]HEU4458228.1 DUF1579 family protein [Methylibium sp.]
MNLAELHPRLAGRWAGRKHLWLEDQPTPQGTSASALLIAPAAKGCFLRFEYSWAHQEAEHEGLLIVGHDDKRLRATAVWIDSWHMRERVMHLQGSIDAQGAISLLGAYRAPIGPDLGWRIGIMKTGPDDLRIVMHDISPEGDKTLAVRADYRRER